MNRKQKIFYRLACFSYKYIQPKFKSLDNKINAICFKICNPNIKTK